MRASLGEAVDGRSHITPPNRWTALAQSRAVATATAALPFVVIGTLTFANTSDDPLITMRYAFNLLHHGQPTFNLGDHVEGYSSPLHLLLATALLVLPGGYELLKLKLLSVVFAAGALWQTGKLSKAMHLPQWAQLAVLFGVAGSWNFVVSASNGLETSLVAFLTTGAVASLARGEAVKHPVRPALWTALLAVSRPESVIVVFVLAVVGLWRETGGPPWRRNLWIAGPAISVGALLAFRMAYYGELVPNTYFAKRSGLFTAVRTGIHYLIHAQPLAIEGRSVGLVIALVQAGLVLVAVRWAVHSRSNGLYPASALLAQVALCVFAGGDWMKGGRFIVPILPAMTVLLLQTVDTLLANARRRVGSRFVYVRAVAVAAMLAVLVAPVSADDFTPAWRLTSGVSDRNLISEGNYLFSADWVGSIGLASCLRPGQLVAFSEAGLFGYEHLRLRVLDTRGLTDASVATSAPAAEKQEVGVVDPHAYLPTSPVGKILVRRLPAMVISFDYPPRSSILGGRYRLGRVFRPRTGPVLAAYIRSRVACFGQA